MAEKEQPPKYPGRGRGRPKGSRNSKRPMVQSLAALKLDSMGELIAHFKEVNHLIELAKRRDDVRDAGLTKSLVIQRGQILRSILPWAFHKQAQIVSVDNKTAAKKPISIKLNLGSSKTEGDEIE